uniref:NYN domain-containing protein n=2 Tax=Brassica oleracea var. oleracea TaxID=109376 RepID=A0A0D3AHT6_BRAOL
MLDFSERIKHVKGPRTVVFWDAIDCPFPLCFSPEQIFQKIKSVLMKKGTNDNITIWAYVDERSWRDKCLGNKTWDSRIYFLPAGDRRVRMLNDMYLQCRDAPLHHCPGLLILVSNHFSGDPFYMELFEDMQHKNYHPFLITPREHSNISESPDEWPQSLFARKSSQGPLPKKPKLDAA